VKKIEAIIRPFKLHEVRAALEDMRIQMGDTTFGPAAELGYGTGVAEILGGTAHVFEGRPVVKLELVVQDRSVERVRDAIATAARTGRVGDGRLVITSIDERRPGSERARAARPATARNQPSPIMPEGDR
jgi:nitrogen regulatory protein P-II 1